MFENLLEEMYKVISLQECEGMECCDCPLYIDKDDRLCDDITKLGIKLKKRLVHR